MKKLKPKLSHVLERYWDILEVDWDEIGREREEVSGSVLARVMTN